MSAVRWIQRHAGRRGAFLAFLTVLDLAFGYSVFELPRAALLQINILLPLHVWGWLWIGTGIICASGIFIQADRVQYTLAALLKTAWGLLYAYLWWQGVPNSWASVVVWLSFAMTVVLIASWPESAKITTPELPRIPGAHDHG
jgi:hypothetical protein